MGACSPWGRCRRKRTSNDEGKGFMETAARAPSYVGRNLYRAVREYMSRPGAMEDYRKWLAERAGKEDRDARRDDAA